MGDTETENTLFVQVLLVFMIISWPLAIIVKLLDVFTGLELYGWATHIAVWPIVVVGLVTFNDVPQREIKKGTKK